MIKRPQTILQGDIVWMPGESRQAMHQHMRVKIQTVQPTSGLCPLLVQHEPGVAAASAYKDAPLRAGNRVTVQFRTKDLGQDAIGSGPFVRVVRSRR